MLQRLSLTALVALAACASAPPAPNVQRPGTTINASAGRAWDAVIDQFAARNIPIRTMERASGFIATDQLAANAGKNRGVYYDCGTSMGTPIAPALALYNVVVRGDSAHATVKATVRWTAISVPTLGGAVPSVECSTQGGWEREFEAAVKAAAEQPR